VEGEPDWTAEADPVVGVGKVNKVRPELEGRTFYGSGCCIALSTKRSSLLRYRLNKLLATLALKEGRHTELISLYVPSDRQISDVMSLLRQEYGTASNIKSKSTRKNVVDAIEKVMQRLRLFKVPPENGLVIFCGAIPQNGVGSEKIETYVLEPPEPITLYYYRCDQRFHIEPLEEMLKERDTYGIVTIDGNEATIATLRGRSLEIIKSATSGLPGKHDAGGQSQRRFERNRESEVNEYYKRVGGYINDVFLPIPDLKGIIFGGPGPTKDDFQKGEYTHYTLRDKVLATVDTSYTDDYGVKEAVSKAQDVLQEVRYLEEKKIVQGFLYEIGHDTGRVTYGEEEVRDALTRGVVRSLIISEAFNESRITVACGNCDYVREDTVKNKNVQDVERELTGTPCPKCGVPTLKISAVQDVLEDLAELAEQTGADVEVISTQTEEGVELRSSFGGIAAILRYRQE
jgi:peptide chain release factor subunit 1